MVGVLLSAVVDCHTYPCLCVDAMPTTNVKPNKHLVRRGGTMELSNSFLEPVREWHKLCVNRSFKNKQRRDYHPRAPIVNELGGQYDDTFHDVKTQILNYFTYKAVRTVLLQLYEMNPPQYRLLYNFVATNNPTEGKRFIRSLAKEQQGLAERVMVTRLHLYGKWAKKCNHGEIYKEISDENLELMRERLMETVIWPSDDTNTEKVG